MKLLVLFLLSTVFVDIALSHFNEKDDYSDNPPPRSAWKIESHKTIDPILVTSSETENENIFTIRSKYISPNRAFDIKLFESCQKNEKEIDHDMIGTNVSFSDSIDTEGFIDINVELSIEANAFSTQVWDEKKEKEIKFCLVGSTILAQKNSQIVQVMKHQTTYSLKATKQQDGNILFSDLHTQFVEPKKANVNISGGNKSANKQKRQTKKRPEQKIPDHDTSEL